MSYAASRNGSAPSLALKHSGPKLRSVGPAISLFKNAASITVFTEAKTERRLPMESEDNIKHTRITAEDTLPVKGTPIFHDGSIYNKDEITEIYWRNYYKIMEQKRNLRRWYKEQGT